LYILDHATPARISDVSHGKPVQSANRDLGAHLPMGVGPLGDIVALKDAGNLKVLAVASAQ
jgi:tripartite-type tricarboxylate transporter receptor subunit TctC